MSRSLLQLEAVILDHAVGEQLAAHVVHPLACPFAIGRLQRQLDILPEMYLARLIETEGVQRMLDGLSLWIEHPLLGRNEDAGAHRRHAVMPPCTRAGT